MVANSQQFGANRSDSAPKQVNEVNFSSLEQRLIDLTSLVRQMAVGNGQNMKVCGICTAKGHATDMCPTLQEGSNEQDHPNLRYGNPAMNQPAPSVNQPNNQAFRPQYPPQPQRPQIPTQETRASIQHLNTQMGKLATAINRLEALNSNSLPSQTVVNPKENNKDVEEFRLEENEIIPKDAPRALKESRKDDGIKGLYEVFHRCEVNIPLLDVIKQVSRYAKFLKELCTVKRKQKLKGCQKVELGEQVSAVIQRKVPTKCKDPVSRIPPPPQTKFQYDSSVMLSDVEEDSANT
ncbi:uncharacterized protein [Henckelia pumila]|uniref:uncharacterized protein n=1 Tax=Henckelia pumila TaxID=405737 RepID=UPI003C6DD57E